MSILIVDDNPTNLLIIVKMLENAGYSDLVTVSSAKELFRKLKMDTPTTQTEIPVDLILLDMMMPEIDGIEACKRIQQVERLKDIPIIFVTAMWESNKLAEALDAGATDYVIKPVNKIELLARVRSALRLKFEKDWHKEREKRINYELELAKQVQASVLSQPIDDENITISSVYQPSFELAGDFYAWYRINNHQYGIILLDMMGHGISSSLVCMFISSVLQDTIKRISDPEQVIHELNRYMNRLHMIDKLDNYYFTAIYLVLDTEQKTIEYVNAGHPPGLVYLDNKVSLLEQSCCAIGFFENIKINKGMLQYQDTVKIILYTDGLIGMMEEDRDDGVHKLIEKMQEYKDLDLPELMEKLIPEGNNDEQDDDVCVVMIKTK